MKIGIIGNYGATNVGDDAILTAILKSLSGHDITVFSADPHKTKDQYGVKAENLFPLGIRSAFKNGFSKSVHALKKLDIVILGGGGLFQDNYLYACLLWTWQVLWVKAHKKPLFIYATGVGPVRSWLGRKLTGWAHNQADIISVRDKYSAEELIDMGVAESKIHITADAAFIYQKQEIGRERTKNTIIISLRPWLGLNSKIVAVFTEFLLKLKQEKDYNFVFTSMQEIKEADQKVIQPILKKVGGELYIPNHFADLLQIMQTAEFAIGMRYHFLIAAILTQTPVIPITYAPKTEELFSGTPLESYVIPVDEITVDSIMDQLKRLSYEYNNVKIFERARSAELSELAKGNFRLFEQFEKSLTVKKITAKVPQQIHKI